MNYYAKAIEIIQDESLNYRELIYEIAKENPGAIVSAMKRISPSELVSPIDWKIKAREFIVSEQFIKAIKYCRAETGMGLKEAKEACDLLKQERG